MVVTINKDYRITLSREVVKALGVHPGDKINFSFTGKVMLLTLGRRAKSKRAPSKAKAK